MQPYQTKPKILILMNNFNMKLKKSFNNNSIPDGWEKKKLDEIGDFKKGAGLFKEQLSSKGLPCVRYGEIYTTHDTVIKNFGSFITKTIAKESVAIKKNDILFAGSGETREDIGKAVAYLKDEEAYAGGDIIILRPFLCFDSHYLSYALQSEDANRQKYKLGEGHSVVHIYPNELKTLKIPLPPLPEQKAIAAVLSAWDKAIETTQKLVEQKELRKKALMQQLLSGKKRLKGFAGKWNRYLYKDILVEVKRSINWSDNTKYDLISVRRNSRGVFFRESLNGRQILTKNLFRVKNGDFLFSKMQILHGASGLVTQEFENMYVSGSYISVVSRDPNILDIRYLDLFSRTPRFYYQSFISSYGVTIEKMTFEFDYFMELDILLPDIDEQREIINVLTKAEKDIELLKLKTSLLKEQKKGLMQKLLTGKVRIKP